MACKKTAVLLILSIGAVLSRPLLFHIETCDSSNTVVVCERMSGKFLPEGNPNITVLHIIESDMTSLSEDDVLKFKNLETINIAGCIIPVELGNILSHLEKLESLEISNCNVGGGFALVDLRSLISLSLEGNRLTRLSEGALVNLPLLETLDLSSNAIAEVEAGALEALPRLRELRLEGNPLCEGARGGGSPEEEERRWKVLEAACGAGEGGVSQGGGMAGGGSGDVGPGGNRSEEGGGGRGTGSDAAGLSSGEDSRSGVGAGERVRLSQGQVLLLLLGWASGMVVGVAFALLLSRRSAPKRSDHEQATGDVGGGAVGSDQALLGSATAQPGGESS